MKSVPHIVSTRRLTSGKVDELKKSGWKFTDHDFISKLIHIPADLQAQAICKYVVLTSITGVRAFLEITRQLQLDTDHYQVYCISRGTREYASASGLDIKSSAPNAFALANEILKDVEVKEVTHVSSNLRRDELSDKLNRAGVTVHDVIAYHTEFTPISIDHSYDAIIFFSPSAVDSFLSLNPLLQVPCFCLGKTTGDYAKQEGYHHTHIPEAPSEDILLKTIINYF